MSWTCIFSTTWYTCKTINHGTRWNMEVWLRFQYSPFTQLKKKNLICATSKHLIWSTFAIVYIWAWRHQYTKMKTHESTPGTYMHRHTHPQRQTSSMSNKLQSIHTQTHRHPTIGYSRAEDWLIFSVCGSKKTMWRQIRDWSDRQTAWFYYLFLFSEFLTDKKANSSSNSYQDHDSLWMSTHADIWFLNITHCKV